MSDIAHEPLERPTYVASFEGGPRDGTQVMVLSLESGAPPEILLTPGQPEWVYLLAGGRRADGSLPYLYMGPGKAAAVLRRQAVSGRDIPRRT